MKLKKQLYNRKEVEPRATAEIDNEYKVACGNLGAIQYQLESLKQQSRNLVNRIAELVQENKRRTDLDTKKEQEDVKSEG